MVRRSLLGTVVLPFLLALTASAQENAPPHTAVPAVELPAFVYGAEHPPAEQKPPPVPPATPVGAPEEGDLDVSAGAPQWHSLTHAQPIALRLRHLILLHIRGIAWSEGVEPDSWLTGAIANPTTGPLIRQFVLAVEEPGGEAIETSPELSKLRGRSAAARLVVLDQNGHVLLEPAGGFEDIDKFGRELEAVHSQRNAFVHAAELDARSQALEATLVRAGAFLAAGGTAAAAEEYVAARNIAQRDHHVASEQRATLGLAAIDLQLGRRQAALDALNELVRTAAAPDVAAAAWLSIGHARRAANDETAVSAYQKAYDAAPKPSAYAEAARHFLEMLGSAPKSAAAEIAAKGHIALLYPHRDVLVGTIDVGAVAPPAAARVEFYLDGARVAEATRSPFRARISLGDSPRSRTIRAVAYDRRDSQIAEAVAKVNDVVQSVAVNIVEPKDDAIAQRALVRLETRVPEGSRLIGVDLYWNEQKLTTFTAPPFTYELTLPSASAPGYIRAVVRDDSGRTAEDVRLINVQGGAEDVRVDAVSVIALVQDREGHRIEDLDSSDFDIREDGGHVDATILSSASDPIAVGIALDTSSSMRVAMRSVISYAKRFIQDALLPGDATFIVGFDEKPRILQPLTTDRTRATAVISDTRASGATALWDGILFSLQQFGGVKGKRAFVVFTDGDNTTGVASARSALRYAREIGVPVYVVEMFTSMRQLGATAEKPPSESRLQEIAEATGGAFYRFSREQDLSSLFEQIRNDVRGQYVLTYVSPSRRPRTELRKISVSVRRRDATVRAPSGYYPR